MSSESVRKRLEAATPGPWRPKDWEGAFTIDAIGTRINRRGREVETVQDVVGPSSNDWGMFGTIDRTEDAELIAHAPADLAAALKVIEAAKEWRDTADGDDHLTHDAAVGLLEVALAEFEALP